MLACDQCNDWFHGKCVNVQKGQAANLTVYYCPPCVAKHGLPPNMEAELAMPPKPDEPDDDDEDDEDDDDDEGDEDADGAGDDDDDDEDASQVKKSTKAKLDRLNQGKKDAAKRKVDAADGADKDAKRPRNEPSGQV
jgi:hypothetical protein